jgi:hypothetical protein
VGAAFARSIVMLFVPLALGFVAGISLWFAVFFMRRRSVA